MHLADFIVSPLLKQNLNPCACICVCKCVCVGAPIPCTGHIVLSVSVPQRGQADEWPLFPKVLGRTNLFMSPYHSVDNNKRMHTLVQYIHTVSVCGLCIHAYIYLVSPLWMHSCFCIIRGVCVMCMCVSVNLWTTAAAGVRKSCFVVTEPGQINRSHWVTDHHYK